MNEVAISSRKLVLKKLRDAFPDHNVAANVLLLLDEYGPEPWHSEKDRLHLAILKVSEGNLDSLCSYVESAKHDYRDVLAAAEYPEEDFRVRGSHPSAKV